MLLSEFTTNLSALLCMPGKHTMHCKAILKEDISEALPYLNANLGGFAYQKNPTSVSFKMHGKLITVHGKLIYINAIKDKEEAHNILTWLQKEINLAWQNKENIVPKYEDAPKPKMLNILKLLPQKINCQKCSLPTCIVFANRLSRGLIEVNNCPEIKSPNKEDLLQYLSNFTFED